MTPRPPSRADAAAAVQLTAGLVHQGLLVEQPGAQVPADQACRDRRPGGLGAGCGRRARRPRRRTRHAVVGAEPQTGQHLTLVAAGDQDDGHGPPGPRLAQPPQQAEAGRAGVRGGHHHVGADPGERDEGVLPRTRGHHPVADLLQRAARLVREVTHEKDRGRGGGQVVPSRAPSC